MKAKILAAAVLLSLVVAVSFSAVSVRQVQAADTGYCAVLYDQYDVAVYNFNHGYMSEDEWWDFNAYLDEQLHYADCE